MKILFAIFVSVLLISPFDTSAATQITFTASGQAGNPVKLVFNGSLYEDKRTFHELLKDKAPLTDLQKFLMKVIEINTSGGKNQILSLWAPKERADIKKYVDNAQFFKKNTAFYRNVISSRLVAYIDFGNYSICYIEHNVKGIGKYVKMYPVVHIKKQLYLSNGLSGDFFYNNIAAQLMSYFKK